MGLPTGVKTTHSLLVAITTTPHTPLSLATALNRFLNIVSHLAMNMWGLSKLNIAGARLAVTEWLVELRHETTHGQMPGLPHCLGWPGWMLTTGGRRGGGGYQVWGIERITELQGQEDVWNHFQELWEVVKWNHSLEDISVKQAVGLVKTEVCNLCEGEEGIELLAEVLVREDLLIPEKEFVDSLEEGSEGDPNGAVMVPRQLLLIWSEFVQIIDKVVLVDKLLEKVKQVGEGTEVCAA